MPCNLVAALPLLPGGCLVPQLTLVTWSRRRPSQTMTMRSGLIPTRSRLRAMPWAQCHLAPRPTSLRSDPTGPRSGPGDNGDVATRCQPTFAKVSQDLDDFRADWGHQSEDEEEEFSKVRSALCPANL